MVFSFAAEPPIFKIAVQTVEQLPCCIALSLGHSVLLFRQLVTGGEG